VATDGSSRAAIRWPDRGPRPSARAPVWTATRSAR